MLNKALIRVLEAPWCWRTALAQVGVAALAAFAVKAGEKLGEHAAQRLTQKSDPGDSEHKSEPGSSQ